MPDNEKRDEKVQIDELHMPGDVAVRCEAQIGFCWFQRSPRRVSQDATTGTHVATAKHTKLSSVFIAHAVSSIGGR